MIANRRVVAVLLATAFGLCLLAINETALAQDGPVGSPVASCAASTPPSAQPQEPSTPVATSPSAVSRAHLVRATENLIACWNQGDWRSFANLSSERVLQSLVQLQDPEIAVLRLRELQSAGYIQHLDLQVIGDPVVTGSTGSVMLTVQEGYMVRREEWRFTRIANQWILASINSSALHLAVNAVGFPVTLDQFSISSTRDFVVNPGGVVFDLVNTSDRDIGVIVTRTSPEMPADEILSVLSHGGDVSPFLVAWISVPAASVQSLALVDLPTGNYLIVAGFDPRAEIPVQEALNAVEIAIERQSSQ